MSNNPLYTFQDASEHLDNVFNPSAKPSTGRDARLKRAATINAYREMPTKHRWSYYQRRSIVTTEASYSTGTIEYDHTGGTYERQVTLTSGTWPDNAAFGVIVVSNVHYTIEQRVSDTVVTLGAAANPGADVASGTSFVWYRDSYPLPLNFLSMDELIDITDGSCSTVLLYCSPSEHLQRSRNYGGSVTTRPYWYTIRNAGNYVGALSLVFGRPPSSARSYEFTYMLHPSTLQTHKEATGTVTVAAGSNTVTGNGTSFSSSHVGSVVRFTTSTTEEPTTVIGNVDGTVNPFLSERIIVSVTSSTVLTVDAAADDSTAISGAKYTISDLIDVEPNAMLPYFLRLVELEYSKLSKRDDWRQRAMWSNEALMDAIDADIRDRSIQSGMHQSGRRYWHTLGDVTTGGPGE